VCFEKGVNPFPSAFDWLFWMVIAMGLSLNVVEIDLNAKEIIPWRN
jgi:hypothetical protein